MILIYERVRPGAYAPAKKYPEDAGWDIRSYVPFALEPGQRLQVQTGLAIKLQPSGKQEELARAMGASWYWRAADKSGLANDVGVHILGGVIDRNYRGELLIVVKHLGFWTDGKVAYRPWTVAAGDKICQIVPELIADCQAAQEGPVGTSDRGANGFGSTGQ
jgi:dUTP pyrophosphatase